MIKGNKGEWSEFYTFLKLLADGELHGSDGNLQPNPKMCLAVLKVLRDTLVGHYENGREKVALSFNGKTVHYEVGALKEYVEKFLTEIQEGSKRSFESKTGNAILSEVNCAALKASSAQKKDIDVVVLDNHVGAEQCYGFSIKSFLGGAPTLLNASEATAFIFEAEGLEKNEAKRINTLKDPKKGRVLIKERVDALNKSGARIKFISTNNLTFQRNLISLDDSLPEILAELLKVYWLQGVGTVREATERLKKENPRGYPDTGLYEIKIKRFLRAVALGMLPSVKWNDLDNATGGYIVVRKDGVLVAFYVYNRAAFDDYLFNQTYFDRPDSGRVHSLEFDVHGERCYFDLCLNIRFKSPSSKSKKVLPSGDSDSK